MTKLSEVGTHATTVFTDTDGMTKVIFHQTAVVKWDHNFIVLDSGGWLTNTTKTRMNQASNQFRLGFQVFQKDFEWFVRFRGEVLEFDDEMLMERPTNEFE